MSASKFKVVAPTIARLRILSVLVISSFLATCLHVPSVEAVESQDSGVVVHRDIAYGQAPDEDGQLEVLRLDLYEPPPNSEVLPWRPALVLMHGGFFSHGDKAEPAVAAMATYAAELGYVVASINYRLRLDQGPDYPIASSDAQHDAQAAVRWMRSNSATYAIDQARIGISGFSAGGMAALRVATRPTDPGDSGSPGPSSSVIAAVGLSAFLPVDVESTDSDLLLLNGDLDSVIHIEWAQETCFLWREAGGDCRLVAVANGVHDSSAWIGEYLPVLERFLACQLGGAVSFTDIASGSEAMRTVGWGTATGVLAGTSDRAFRPTAGLTRSQLASWMWKLLGHPEPETHPAFRDLPETSSSYKAAAWAVERQILFRKPTGAFDPRQIVTRSAAAVALWRVAGRSSDGATLEVPGVDPHAPYAAAVGWWAAHGFLSAFRSPVFDPRAPLLRLQTLRLLRQLSEQEGAWVSPPQVPLCFGP